MTALAPTLQSFFTAYLIGQRAASTHTITAYRDTLRMLLQYTHRRTGIQHSDLDIMVLDAELVADFLTYLQDERGNSARTRNARLAAIHSLFKHAALRHPEHADLIARVLAIAPKNSCFVVTRRLRRRPERSHAIDRGRFDLGEPRKTVQRSGFCGA